jgi:hypothetical protein
MGDKAMRVRLRNLHFHLLGSPKRGRLEDFIADVWQEMGGRPVAADGLTEWKREVYDLLSIAEDDMKNWQLERGFRATVRAYRVLLKGMGDKGRIARVAISLNRERVKVKGWRAKAIEDFLLGPDGKLLTGKDEQEIDLILDALAHRDDFFQNEWYKIDLRRKHLISLFLLLLLGVLVTISLAASKILPTFMSDGPLVAMVVLLGVLGACLSVSQGLISAGLSEKIPEQYLGAFVIWMRPAIGAVAALATFSLLEANKELDLVKLDATPSIIAIFAFVAGYSERFIVGALGKVSDTFAAEKKD